MAATDGSLPKDVSGYVSEGVYVPGVGTVAQQGSTTITTDSTGTPSAPGMLQLITSAVGLNDGLKASYSASKTALVPAASATDIFTVTGSATKTVRITRLYITGTAGTAANFDVVLLVRSTANTGGTSTGSPTIVAYDQNSASATATVLSYTANPTVGNLVGNIAAQKMFLNVAATGASDKLIFDFGNRPSQAVVLRGTSQVFAVNLNAQSISSGSLDIFVEWTEE